jgi:hypothetical protein
MTEAEWLACADPTSMLACLRGKLTPRKVRLFGCACHRRIWHLLDATTRTFVRMSEQEENEAEGKQWVSRWEAERKRWVSRWMEEKLKGHRPSQVLILKLPDCHRMMELHLKQSRDIEGVINRIAGLVHANANDTHAALRAPPGDEIRAARAAWAVAESAKKQEQTSQCDLLREIVGNPFRQVSLDSTWMTPGVVSLARAVSLAQALYNDRAIAHLPILASALEAVGCDNADVLNHCRQPGKHVRGCWVLDLLLGKE